MTTDPGDLVLDPTCGSGTTAYVAEQWGWRWITIDTSRAAISLARSGCSPRKYDYYQIKDQEAGDESQSPRSGFIYKNCPAHHAQVHRTEPCARSDLRAPEPVLAEKLPAAPACEHRGRSHPLSARSSRRSWPTRSGRRVNPRSRMRIDGDGCCPKSVGRNGRCLLTPIRTGPKPCRLR